MNSSSPEAALLDAARPAGARLGPVDLAAYAAGNTGVPFATTWDSGIAGPHGLILALTHGNELCGAHALDHLFRHGVRPQRGRLTLAFGNIAAHATYHAQRPLAARYLDQDFNRVWEEKNLDGPGMTRELVRARALRPLIDTVDHLLDLHSMQTPSPPLALAGTAAKNVALARALTAPFIVVDAGHAEGRRLRDYGGFDDVASRKSAVLLECGQHEEPASRAVAIENCYRFLHAIGLIGRDAAELWLGAPARPARVVTVTAAVTVRTPDFQFVRDFAGMEVVPDAGTPIARDGADIVVTPHDDCVLVMPSRRQRPGQTAVRFGRIAA